MKHVTEYMRAEIAAMAMQGMLASGHCDTLETIANDAVIAADMLLKALECSSHSPMPESRTTTLSSPINEI